MTNRKKRIGLITSLVLIDLILVVFLFLNHRQINAYKAKVYAESLASEANMVELSQRLVSGQVIVGTEIWGKIVQNEDKLTAKVGDLVDRRPTLFLKVSNSSCESCEVSILKLFKQNLRDNGAILQMAVITDFSSLRQLRAFRIRNKLSCPCFLEVDTIFPQISNVNKSFFFSVNNNGLVNFAFYPFLSDHNINQLVINSIITQNK